jgi:hypothetical protein
MLTATRRILPYALPIFYVRKALTAAFIQMRRQQSYAPLTTALFAIKETQLFFVGQRLLYDYLDAPTKTRHAELHKAFGHSYVYRTYVAGTVAPVS